MLKTIYFGKLSGIGLYLHWTFWLLILYLFLSELGRGIGHAVATIGFVFTVFICVFLHELGHAFSGRWFGVQTHDITLYPIGGVARMQAKELTPFAELVIAACGPLVNLVIAFAIAMSFVAKVSWENATDIGSLGPWEHLFIVNVALFCFNLLPVYPMDGGRILRAILKFFVAKDVAIEWSARLGQVLSAGFGLYGLFTLQISIVIIFTIMFFVCSAELFQVRLRRTMAAGSTPWSPAPWGGPSGSSDDSRAGDIIDAEDVRRVR
jgi:Zn-dependent protease